MPTYGQARVGARLGAMRLGYVTPVLVIEIDGIDRTGTSVVESLTIRDYLNGQPNQATLQLRGAEPQVGNEIKIGIGNSLHWSDLVFAGHILSVTRSFPAADTSDVFWDLQCISYEWLLNRRTITKRYTSQSASAIAADIIATFTSGFSAAGIEPGLPQLDEFSLTGETVSGALDRLTERVGASWLVDYGQVVRLGYDVSGGASIGGITDSAVRGLQRGMRSDTDLSQVRTRVLMEGGGSNTATDVMAGETILPVEDESWYTQDGGEVICEAQRITYTHVGIMSGGAIIGRATFPSTAPNVALAAGSGITSGSHYYAVTFYDGSGETTPGPNTSAVTMGAIDNPVSDPTPTAGGSGSLGAGTYRYKYTWVDSAGGQTLPSPALPSVTLADVSNPTTLMSAIAGDTVGGALDPNAAYAYTYSFVTAAGETLTGYAAGNGQLNYAFTSSSGTERVLLRIPGSSDTNVTKRRVYRTEGGGSAFKLAFEVNGRSTTDVWDTVSDGALGATEPASNTSRPSAIVVEVPVGPSGTASRKLFRTTAGGSSYALAATISDNTTTLYTDTLADGSLGAAAPASNTTAVNQANLSAIPLGPSGTTGRKVYRTAAGGTQLKLLATIADNSTVVYADSTADGSLGANVPTSNTSGLTTPDGVVNAGSTTIPVTGVAWAQGTPGGWARAGGQIIRYGDASSSELLLVPASGYGALTSSLNYGTEVIAVPMLRGVPASGDGSIVRDIPPNAAVNVLVQVDDTSAQTVMADAVGGDGVVELYLRDGRLSLDEATNRAQAKLDEVKDPLVTVEYSTRDMTTRSGLEVSITRTEEGVEGTFMVQQVTMSGFSADGSYRPLRQVTASSRRFSFERLLSLIQAR